MAGPSWLVDSNRIATKIRSASGSCDPQKVKWTSNPTRSCPNCLHIIDNSDVNQDWPGLPRGVKFDPSDTEIIWHLLAKVGVGGRKCHPFINEFIPTVIEDDGICYTHPQNLPGVKQDGSATHFFHRAVKAYNTGTRKRRKILGDDLGDVRWHKTGRTKPVILDGVQQGCKKIMVLYMSLARGGKAEKTNWVMHQYHLGTEEEEKDGEFVISKIFYQQQQVKQNDNIEQESPETVDAVIAKVDPVTPKSVIPEPPRGEVQCYANELGQKSTNAVTSTSLQHSKVDNNEDKVQPEFEKPCHHDNLEAENHTGEEMCYVEDELETECGAPNYHGHLMAESHPCEMVDIYENNIGEEPKWWDSESQHLLDSQQLVEGLSLCDELLQSQSPNRDGNGIAGDQKGKPCLADYVQLGPENLKKDLAVCQDLILDPANIELDTPPDFRLSQLEFGSQDSFFSWGAGKD